MTNYEKIFSKLGAGVDAVVNALNSGKGRCNFCNNHPHRCNKNCKEGIKQWLLKEAKN